MTYIVKNFDNFIDANNFQEKLERAGAETKMFGVWSAKEKTYIITVKATVY